MYNNKIVSKVIEYIESFIPRIQYSGHNLKIDIVKHVVIDNNKSDISYLIQNKLTGSFGVKVYFKITRGSEVTECDDILEIPKMINNVFVIEGNMRVPTNTLDNDNVIAVYGQNVRINDKINITYVEDSHQPDGYKLTVNIYDDEEPVVFEGTYDNFEAYKNDLVLNQEEIDKIKIKLDTDDVEWYLRYEDVINLINLGTDRTRDSMIDKKVYSPESNLIQYLNSIDIRKKVSAAMKSKFFQYNKIFLKDIQNAINRYFIVASEKNIDIPSTINPLVFDALRWKIVIPENVAYNSTMTDIIDVANTPINGNVNRINELNVCSVIKDDVVYIKCYTYPDQVPVEVAYTTYCTKKVLLNHYWDYDNKCMKPGVKDLKYKLRLKVREGSISDTFDYIEPMPDDKLSVSTRRIPMGNVSDTVRVSMATSMEKQAIELQNSEPALVTAGNDDTDYELSVLLTRFKGNKSTVTKIQDNKIWIKDESTGSIEYYQIPDPTPSANDSIISFQSTVKVGDTISDGDVIIQPDIQKRKSFELGINANAVYMSYLGLTHEDAMVISESMADKMIHYSIIDTYKELYQDDIINYIEPIGSRIKSKDILINTQTKLRVNQALKETYTGNTGLLQGMGISYNQSNLIVPNNIEDGYILDAKIVIFPNKDLTSEKSNQVIAEYRNQSPKDDYKFLDEKYRNLKANDINDLPDSVAGYISYKLLRVDRCKIGDKLSNRYGGKGIVSLVLPNDLMPQIIKADGSRTHSEIILNPGGVLHRMNVSQIYECALTKIIEHIHKTATELISDGKVSELRKLLDKFKVVYKDTFSKLSDKELVDLHNTKGIYAYKMPVGFYSKVSNELVKKWMKELNLTEHERIFCPDIVLAETKNGLKGFHLKDYVQQPDHMNIKKYELGYTENPSITGREYMMKLWKQANYDGKVTSELMESNEPVMGKGKYRWEGQKIGEMELWILIGSGIESFVQSQSETMKSSQYLFLNELLLSGYFIQDQAGNPILSSAATNAKQVAKLDK